ncbi:MAG: SpoIID/LytB domain-containing protein [Trichlorobacter sp.]|uniref:SpoIID/LytB domain-containing protein n=1 Tax=Trichlorobacter sp. TaxID=2911007 RepID=UPI00255FDE5D|nr:SpoIID/LytB domain-containing protein [Trichlorobacter sp.]MDK9719132.1 SpoIID/LytB domain-containing protein [Trichlorobacter sp.]
MNYLYSFIITTFLLLLAGVVPQGAAAIEIAATNEQIRVAISKGADSVTIDGDGILATDETGKPLTLEFPSTFQNERGRVQAGSDSSRLIRLAAAGKLRINGKSYRGMLELSVQNGKLLVVNQLPLEQYLVGLINSEISSTWPMESIKTQAVIARTFAVAKRKERSKAFYHLESTVMDQAYEGSDDEDSRAARGVVETQDQVLTYNGAVIQAFYHANSGGRTEASQNVWGIALPYLQGVECQYGLTSTTSSWEQSLPLSKIEAALKSFKVYGLTDIKPGPRNNRSRLKNVVLVTEHGNISLLATKFRMAVGSTVIKSTNFSVRVEGGTAYFNGVGYGHGVGLCQYGAKQRALDGFKYDEILTYYYPGARLSKLSELK